MNDRRTFWNRYPIESPAICPNADVFLQHLTSPFGAFSNLVDPKDAPKYRFIFRGQSDSSYRLVPTSLRAGSKQDELLWSINASHDSGAKPVDRNKERSQRRAELRVAQYFYQYCERAGLPLPPISNPLVREELLTGNSGELAVSVNGIRHNGVEINEAQWPPKVILPLLGLAQHYGLPTRLLDWSFSSLVSGYFAASGATKRLENGDDGDSLCCVWFTIANAFDSYGQLELMMPNGVRNFRTYPARLVQPPSAENPNLMLQRGVFTVVLGGRLTDVEVATDRRELPEVLTEFKNTADNIFPNHSEPLFFALYLPIKESPQLLLRLQQLGYSADRIYHGFSGAAEAVRQHAGLNHQLQILSEARKI